MSVARLKKNFYICSVFQEYMYDITYCESVFRKSLIENVVVFFIGRMTQNNTHFV